MDSIDVLKNTNIFKDLQEEELYKISAILHRRSYNRGEIIFEEGEPSKTMYIIEEGQVNVAKEVNNETKILASLQAGDLFGEMAFIETAPRSAGVIIEKDSIIWSMSASDFVGMLKNLTSQSVAKIMMRFLQETCRRLRQTTEHLSGMT